MISNAFPKLNVLFNGTSKRITRKSVLIFPQLYRSIVAKFRMESKLSIVYHFQLKKIGDFLKIKLIFVKAQIYHNSTDTKFCFGLKLLT